MEEDLYDPYSCYKGNDIHYTAIIYPNVKMGKGNKIGPYCVIGSDGEIRDCKNFEGFVEIGDNNVISEKKNAIKFTREDFFNILNIPVSEIKIP